MTTVVVSRFCAGKEFALQIPVRMAVDGVVIIDALTAGAAATVLDDAVREHFGEERDMVTIVNHKWSESPRRRHKRKTNG